MSRFVGNPKDRFSRIAAHIMSHLFKEQDLIPITHFDPLYTNGLIHKV